MDGGKNGTTKMRIAICDGKSTCCIVLVYMNLSFVEVLCNFIYSSVSLLLSFWDI